MGLGLTGESLTQSQPEHSRLESLGLEISNHWKVKILFNQRILFNQCPPFRTRDVTSRIWEMDSTHSSDFLLQANDNSCKELRLVRFWERCVILLIHQFQILAVNSWQQHSTSIQNRKWSIVQMVGLFSSLNLANNFGAPLKNNSYLQVIICMTTFVRQSSIWQWPIIHTILIS